jgi:hypothetical protein
MKQHIEMVRRLCGEHMPPEPFRVSLCFDATKVVEAFLVNARSAEYCGMAFPDHLMPLVEESFEKIEYLKEQGMLATEIKVAVITFLDMPQGTSPFFICGAIPVTKGNAAHHLNVAVVRVLKELEEDYRLIQFLTCSVDGVAYENRFITSLLFDYLDGKNNVSIEHHHVRALQTY